MYLNGKAGSGSTASYIAKITTLCIAVSCFAYPSYAGNGAKQAPQPYSSKFLLTIHGPQPLPAEPELDSISQSKVLSGQIQIGSASERVGQQIDSLLDSALDGDKRFDKLTRTVAHYSTKSAKAVAKTKEAINYAVPYRGCGPSRKAADVILDEEEVDPDDAESAGYSKQRVIDETHPQIVRAVLQVAEAFGQQGGSARDVKLAKAQSELTNLVGKKGADATVALVGSVSESEAIANGVFKAPEIDIGRREDLVGEITRQAMTADPVVAHLKKRLHKYADHSYLAEKFSGMVQGSMALITWLGPGFFIPTAAEAINTTYTMSTGGNEEDKLLKSVYFDKRLESRWRAVNREATLSVDAYEKALRQKNKPLLICAQSIIAQLVGDENVNNLGLPGTRTAEMAASPQVVR